MIDLSYLLTAEHRLAGFKLEEICGTYRLVRNNDILETFWRRPRRRTAEIAVLYWLRKERTHAEPS